MLPAIMLCSANACVLHNTMLLTYSVVLFSKHYTYLQQLLFSVKMVNEYFMFTVI